MENKRLIEQLKAELRQARQDWKDGKCIPIAEFDWGLPLRVAQAGGKGYQLDENF